MMRGDIAAVHESHARMAKEFQDHPLRRIREWAEREEKSQLAEAEAEREREQNEDLR